MNESTSSSSRNKIQRRGPYKQYLKIDSNRRIPESTQRYRNNKICQYSATIPLNLSPIYDEDYRYPSVETHENVVLAPDLNGENSNHAPATDSDVENTDKSDADDASFVVPDEPEQPSHLLSAVGSTNDLTGKCSNIVLIAAFVLRHNLTDCGMDDLLTLINSLNTEQVPVPTSKYLFLKNIRSTTVWMKKFYCPQCMNDVRGDNETKICANCNEVMSSFFVYIPLISQLVNLLETPGILAEIEKVKTTQANETYYSDIISGTYYRRLVQKNIIKKDDITLLLNTDGVSPFRSASKSIWPLQIVVNELPFPLRRRNILLCGLWYGKKPSFEIFSQFLVEELKILQLMGFVHQCDFTYKM